MDGGSDVLDRPIGATLFPTQTLLVESGQVAGSRYSPMESPLDRSEQYCRLPEVLYNRACRVVFDPAFGNGLGKGDANSGTEYKNTVGNKEGDSVFREHVLHRKFERHW